MRRLWRLVIILIIALGMGIGGVLLSSGRTRPMPTFMAMFLTNPDGSLCRWPCLFGIRPGKISLPDSVRRLQAQPISHYLPQPLGFNGYNWIGRDFNFTLSKDRTGELFSIHLNFTEPFSPNASVPPGAPLNVSVGDVISTLGTPNRIDHMGTEAMLYYLTARLRIRVRLVTRDAEHLDTNDQDPVEEIYLIPATVPLIANR